MFKIERKKSTYLNLISNIRRNMYRFYLLPHKILDYKILFTLRIGGIKLHLKFIYPTFKFKTSKYNIQK